MAEEVQDVSVANTASLLQHCDTCLRLLQQLLAMEDNSLRLVMDTEPIVLYTHTAGGH